MKNLIQKGYELFHMVVFTLLILSIVSIPVAGGYSIWGVGITVVLLGVIQFVIGVIVRIQPSLFRLKSLWRLDFWLIMSIVDLTILFASIHLGLLKEWPEIGLGAMVLGILLSLVQYSALTSKKFKH